jgi:hypothetical protein
MTYICMKLHVYEIETTQRFEKKIERTQKFQKT